MVAAFACIYLVWGSTYLAIRVVVETLPPFLLASARFAAAGALLTGWLAWRGKFRPTARQWRDNALIGAFLLLGGNGMVSWAEQKIPSGLATLLVSLGPLFIVLLDWLVLVVGRDPARGNRPTRLMLVGLVLGFVGLVLLVGPDLARADAARLDPWSIGAVLLACLSWSIGSMLTRYTRNPAEPLAAAAMQQICGAGWLLLVSLVLGEPSRFAWANVTDHAVVAWLYLVFFGSLAGYSVFVWLMQNTTPARVSTFAYVNPIVAVFLGWWLLDETVSPRLFLAAAIVIAGVALITVARGRPPRAETKRP